MTLDLRSRRRAAGSPSAAAKAVKTAITVAVAGAALVPAAAAMGGAGAQAAAATRDVHAVAGVISTVAGGAGGPARASTVALTPCGVSFAGGSVYAGSDGTVRKISATGGLTTPAGTGVIRPIGNRGPAVKASLNGVCGVAVDQAGNLVIADNFNDRIRMVAG